MVGDILRRLIKGRMGVGEIEIIIGLSVVSS
jgi:hypothetical protein